jgi:hypothetical protein
VLVGKGTVLSAVGFARSASVLMSGQGRITTTVIVPQFPSPDPFPPVYGIVVPGSFTVLREPVVTAFSIVRNP